MTEKNFFDELRQFGNERNEQKLRGLNDYNIMTVLRKEDSEVGLHSNFIYSLINIKDNKHYQGDLFARLFIKYVLGLDDFGKIIDVIAEDAAGRRRIDFVLCSEKYSIGIEMKTRKETKDQDKQIFDYRTELLKNGKGEDNTIIYYLTLDGKDASKKSHEGSIYKSISFQEEILEWLMQCQEQVFNITNLNNAIGYYIDVVKMITGKYISPLLGYKDFFLKKQERYEYFDANHKSELLSDFDESPLVRQGFNEARQKLYNDFYRKLLLPILKDFDNIEFFRYAQNTTLQQIQLVIDKCYSVNIFLNSQLDKLQSIKLGIAWAFYDEAKGNPVLKKRMEDKNDLLSKSVSLKHYIEKNGVIIDGKSKIPKLTIDSLFLVQQKGLEKQLDDNLKREIVRHFNIIKKELALIG